MAQLGCNIFDSTQLIVTGLFKLPQNKMGMIYFSDI